jgi:hypothetical protein
MQNPLPLDDITSLFVVIDDVLETKERKPGRPTALTDSEMMTILIWGTFILKCKNIKVIYDFIEKYHREEFPKFPDYSTFVRHGHRLIPLMIELLQNSLDEGAPLRFADSTMVPVCKNVRADSHKVAAGLAAWGKNHQGWHFGFKLHASVNPEGVFTGIFMTPANEHDAQQLPHLVKGGAKVVVGDGTYGARVMREKLWEEQGVFILAPPHPKQKKKLISFWQKILLLARPKIESAFDYLKEHLHLVSSFPRSIKGYLFHYLRILLAYQFRFLLFTS